MWAEDKLAHTFLEGVELFLFLGEDVYEWDYGCELGDEIGNCYSLIILAKKIEGESDECDEEWGEELDDLIVLYLLLEGLAFLGEGIVGLEDVVELLGIVVGVFGGEGGVWLEDVMG